MRGNNLHMLGVQMRRRPQGEQKRTEGVVMDEVRLALNCIEGVWWRNNVGVAVFDNRKVRFGLCKGSADLIGMYRGRFVAIETKTEIGRLSSDQRRFRDLVEMKRGIYGVVRSAKQATAFLAYLSTAIPA